MAYLRWSYSPWYVYASTEGGLRVHFDVKNSVLLSTEEVRKYLAGERKVEEMPGFPGATAEEREELLGAMKEYIADVESGELD